MADLKRKAATAGYRSSTGVVETLSAMYPIDHLSVPIHPSPLDNVLRGAGRTGPLSVLGVH
jgi:hypothetical protein